MPDCQTCVMEPRIHYIEKKLDEQTQRFADSQKEEAERMARVEESLKEVLNGLKKVSDQVSAVLEDRQQDEIEKARSANSHAAKKWNSLSSDTKSILKSIFLLIVGAAITLFFAKFH